MQLAVIADIHGNADALRAVLSDLARRRVTKLYVNGDVVNRGPDSAECLQMLLSLPHKPTFVLGNHDDFMRLWLERSHTLPPDWFADPFWNATEWSARQLERAGLLPEIATWPMTWRIHGDNYGAAGDVLLAHGTPEHYRESLGRNTSDERIQELLQGDISVLVGSHTHWAMQREVAGKLILNTGAVGAPFNDDPRAQYLLLGVEGGQWRAKLCAVPYDRRPILARYQSSGLLQEGGLSAQIFRDEVRYARSLYTPYWLWTEEENLPKNAETWAQFKLREPDRFKERQD